MKALVTGGGGFLGKAIVGKLLERGESLKTDPSLSFRSYVELSSIEEFRKFKKLGAISESDLDEVDVDELARRLLGSD